MKAAQGFTDLRVSPHLQAGVSDDSVWPSFTDIMTVVVMIFLMALVVIILRNDELVVQLKQTLLSEQASTQQVQQQSQKVRELLYEQSQLESLLTQARTEREKIGQQLTLSQNQGEALKIEVDSLQTGREKLAQENIQLAENLSQLQLAFQSQTEAVEKLTDVQNQTTLQIEELAAKLSESRLEARRLVDATATLNFQREELQTQIELLSGDKENLSAEISLLQQEQEELAQAKLNAEEYLTEQREELRLELTEQEQKVLALQRRYNDLLAQREIVQRDYDELKQEFADVEQQFAQEKQALATELQTTSSAYTATQQQAEALQRQLAIGEEELENLQLRFGSIQLSNTQLAAQLSDQNELLDQQRNRYAREAEDMTELRGDYDALKEKYVKLVRPARSAEGKYIVNVRYTKQDGVESFAIKEPGDSDYRSMARQDLNRHLYQIKQRNPYKLYTRIIIPDNSGLTFSEGWEFTNDILQQYDYYSHEE